MPRQLDEDAAEEAANRILDAFGIDVRNDDEFDRMCIVIERGRNDDPGTLCRRIGKAHLTAEVTTALLMTLLKDPISKMRGKLLKTRDKATDAQTPAEVPGPRTMTFQEKL